jgi:stage III sporulation protein AB
MTGIVLRNDLRKRREEIENFLFGVRIIESEITYAAPSLEICFSRAAERMKGVMRRVFMATAQILKEQGAGGESAFYTALSNERENLALTSPDIEWMGRLGVQLGVTDMENELKNFKYILRRGEESLKEAERNENKWCKVIGVGGWLFGFAAALTVL